MFDEGPIDRLGRCRALRVRKGDGLPDRRAHRRGRAEAKAIDGTFIEHDVTPPDGRQRLDELVSDDGGVDVLVNNAGQHGHDRELTTGTGSSR